MGEYSLHMTHKEDDVIYYIIEYNIQSRLDIKYTQTIY